MAIAAMTTITASAAMMISSGSMRHNNPLETMQIQAVHEIEKCEVNAVLASGVFNRAPNLVNILTYICGKYFDGSLETIKEYNIAVEALGRSPDFDPVSRRHQCHRHQEIHGGRDPALCDSDYAER